MSAKGFRDKRFIGGQKPPALPTEKRKLTTGSTKVRGVSTSPLTVNIK